MSVLDNLVSVESVFIKQAIRQGLSRYFAKESKEITAGSLDELGDQVANAISALQKVMRNLGEKSTESLSDLPELFRVNVIRSTDGPEVASSFMYRRLRPDRWRSLLVKSSIGAHVLEYLNVSSLDEILKNVDSVFDIVDDYAKYVDQKNEEDEDKSAEDKNKLLENENKPTEENKSTEDENELTEDKNKPTEDEDKNETAVNKTKKAKKIEEVKKAKKIEEVKKFIKYVLMNPIIRDSGKRTKLLFPFAYLFKVYKTSDSAEISVSRSSNEPISVESLRSYMSVSIIDSNVEVRFDDKLLKDSVKLGILKYIREKNSKFYESNKSDESTYKDAIPPAIIDLTLLDRDTSEAKDFFVDYCYKVANSARGALFKFSNKIRLTPKAVFEYYDSLEEAVEMEILKSLAQITSSIFFEDKQEVFKILGVGSLEEIYKNRILGNNESKLREYIKRYVEVILSLSAISLAIDKALGGVAQVTVVYNPSKLNLEKIIGTTKLNLKLLDTEEEEESEMQNLNKLVQNNIELKADESEQFVSIIVSTSKESKERTGPVFYVFADFVLAVGKVKEGGSSSESAHKDIQFYTLSSFTSLNSKFYSLYVSEVSKAIKNAEKGEKVDIEKIIESVVRRFNIRSARVLNVESLNDVLTNPVKINIMPEITSSVLEESIKNPCYSTYSDFKSFYLSYKKFFDLIEEIHGIKFNLSPKIAKLNTTSDLDMISIIFDDGEIINIEKDRDLFKVDFHGKDVLTVYNDKKFVKLANKARDEVRDAILKLSDGLEKRFVNKNIFDAPKFVLVAGKSMKDIRMVIQPEIFLYYYEIVLKKALAASAIMKLMKEKTKENVGFQYSTMFLQLKKALKALCND